MEGAAKKRQEKRKQEVKRAQETAKNKPKSGFFRRMSDCLKNGRKT